MIIALDYDDTYTADRDLWNMFIMKAKANQHTVIIVTFRYKEEGAPIEQELRGIVDEIYYTGRCAKKPFLANQNIVPNIWIDDSPEYIFRGILPYSSPTSNMIFLPTTLL